MKKSGDTKKNGANALNNRVLESVVGGQAENVEDDIRYCENCQAYTPHTPTVEGSFSCNICGYDPQRELPVQ